MDPAKIEIIIKWEVFKTVKGVQRFLGFANFYRKFIKKIPQLLMFLTNLILKKPRNPICKKKRTNFFRN